MNLAICFLVINEIEELPVLAIKSVMAQTNFPIFIGYFRERDIWGLPKSTQIHYIKMGVIDGPQSPKYQDFGTEAFYDAVSRKWDLFHEVFNLGFEIVIYNDIDLVWVRDASSEIVKFFSMTNQVDILVQSITQTPAQPSLCMGFVAFRNTPFASDFITDCARLNSESRLRLEKIGDDEVVTLMYQKSGFDSRIRELPQVTFPVGFSINLFKGRPRMPGMVRNTPYIFHANYVIGVRNKRILLRMFLGSNKLRDLGIRKDLSLWVYFVFKSVRETFKRIKTLL
jgi:hypothetical protein